MKSLLSIFVIFAALAPLKSFACDANLARKTALMRDLKEEYHTYFELGIATEVKLYVASATPVRRSLIDDKSKVDRYAVRYFVTVDGHAIIGEFQYIAGMTLSSGYCSRPITTMQSVEPVVMTAETEK
jgi:hypothetical protein